MGMAIPESESDIVRHCRTEFRDLDDGFASVRRAALAEFERLGLPTTREEEWRYTNVSEIAWSEFPAAPSISPALDREELSQWGISETAEVVLVNGYGCWSTRAASIGHCRLEPLRDLLHRGDCTVLSSVSSFVGRPFVALNTALVRDGISITIPAHTNIEKPLHVVFVTGGHSLLVLPRVVLIAEQGSQSSIVEHHVGLQPGGRYLSCGVTEVLLEEDAIVDHIKIQEESPLAYHVSTIEVRQGARSRFSSHLFHFGGRLVRQEVNPTVVGEGCETFLNGLSVVDGDRLTDNHTVIDHAVPHCFSREIFRGIYADRSTGVFSGTIVVRPGAQKTNAIQSNSSLLLSADATVNSKPQLKIWADDVKCTHGATVGELDEQGLFYLRSRGIPESESRGILVRAFAEEVIGHLPHDETRAYIDSRLRSALVRM